MKENGFQLSRWAGPFRQEPTLLVYNKKEKSDAERYLNKKNLEENWIQSKDLPFFGLMS